MGVSNDSVHCSIVLNVAVFILLLHILYAKKHWNKQEAWRVVWSLPEFPNISYFGPQDEFSLQTT